MSLSLSDSARDGADSGLMFIEESIKASVFSLALLTLTMSEDIVRGAAAICQLELRLGFRVQGFSWLVSVNGRLGSGSVRLDS
jgi:hypothetical protein